jgi:hypothetical protein
MNESWSPDPEERRFAEMIREGARELREQRGPCPSSEELAAFFEGRFEPERAARVRSHVEACGLCDAALGRLEAAKQTPDHSHWKSVSGFLSRPFFAYALVLVLLFPAYRGITSSRSAPPTVDLGPLPISAPEFVLDSVRGAQSTPTVRLPLGRDIFILSFLVPLRPQFHYSAEIINSGGAPVSRVSELFAEDKLGHCSLICPRGTFPTGMYSLIVKERTEQRDLTGRLFAFQFVVEE